jgi:hypothetical protein
MLGLRELVMVAAVVLVLYGRSGVLQSRRFQSIWPWISPVRRKPVRPGTGGDARHDGLGASSSSPGAAAGPVGRRRVLQLEGNRLFWFLTILAATAVATTIITRSLILQGGNPLSHP